MYLSKIFKRKIDVTVENDEQSEEKENKIFSLKRRNFSKVMVTFLMAIAVIDMQLSYFLAYIGREEIAETLSVAIATEIIGVMLGYFAKAYFETRSEKNNELERDRLNNYLSGSSIIDDDCDQEDDDEKAVG